MPKIRVLLADDHAVLRAGLKLLISGQPDMEVVGEAADGPEAVQRAEALAPHIVLLDLAMPGTHGMQTIEHLVRVAPRSRVLVLTMHDDPAYSQAALRAGASGYIVKKAADVELLVGIRAVCSGRSIVNLTRAPDTTRSHDQPPGARGTPPRGHPRPLSPRESEVLRLLAQGHTNQEVATLLTVSVKTVETHRKRLGDKLDLRSRAGLFRYAVERGLLAPDAAVPLDK